MTEASAGPLLEARAQRLFLAQGSFAERGVLPTATPDRRMLATDIDVLVSEYVSGFHLTRRHVECKAGRYPLLDRILWLNGVRTLLHADSSYLIATDVDLAASDFARSLDVELFTTLHLEAWEKSLGIPPDSWPCRSDFQTFDAARAAWKTAGSDKEDETWRFLRGAQAFVEVESWLTFKYRLLNKLLRLVTELGRRFEAGGDRDKELCARYTFSALLVRLSQFVLSICEDVSRILPVEVDKYLTNRLTFGDQDPAQATDLTRATIAWVRNALTVHKMTMPAEIDASRLQSPPHYTAEFVSLVKRMLEQSHESRYLPLAVERMQFGTEADDKLPRFRAAAAFADNLAALLKAFVVRTFKVPAVLATPVRADLAAAYKLSLTATPRVEQRNGGVAKPDVVSAGGGSASRPRKDPRVKPEATAAAPAPDPAKTEAGEESPAEPTETQPTLLAEGTGEAKDK